MKIIAVRSDIQENINALCGKSFEFVNVKPGDA